MGSPGLPDTVWFNRRVQCIYMAAKSTVCRTGKLAFLCKPGCCGDIRGVVRPRKYIGIAVCWFAGNPGQRVAHQREKVCV